MQAAVRSVAPSDWLDLPDEDAGVCVLAHESYSASAVFCWPVKDLREGASLAGHFSKLESSASGGDVTSDQCAATR